MALHSESHTPERHQEQRGQAEGLDVHPGSTCVKQHRRERERERRKLDKKLNRRVQTIDHEVQQMDCAGGMLTLKFLMRN